MKKVLAATLIAGSTISSAFAADLPSRKAAAYLPPPPVFTWTGFYVGLNAGGTFGGNNRSTVAGFPLTNTIPGVGGALAFQAGVNGSSTGFPNNGGRNTGAILGVQAGYNWQFGSPFLLGFEADIQGVVSSSQRSGFFNTVATPGVLAGSSISTVGVVSKRLDYLGTVRARLGYAVTPSFLLYVTGGLAYGGVKSNTALGTSFAPTFPGVNITGFSGGYSSARMGYTIGGGGEWMFMPSWSLKAEYLYYDLGSVSYLGGQSISSTGPFPGFSTDAVRTRVRYDGHVARLGVNYHFWAPVAPVVARY